MATGEREQPAGRPRRAKFALALLATVTTLAVAELAFRAKYAADRREILARYSGRELNARKSNDPRLIYTLRPGADGINARGYRGVDFDLTKPAGSFRVVVIGDSVAAGLGVELEQRFGSVLQRRLREALEPRRVEVIVLARGGYSTSQQLVLLEEDALRCAPDLIVWSYVLNDPAHPIFHDANGEFGRLFYEPRIHLWYRLQRAWFRLSEKRRRKSKRQELHDKLHTVYWDEVRANLGRVATLTKAHGVPVLFAITPVNRPHHGDSSGYPLLDLHERLAVLGRTLGFDVVDLRAAMRTDAREPTGDGPGASLWLAPGDPWHPSASGHARIGEALFPPVSLYAQRATIKE